MPFDEDDKEIVLPNKKGIKQVSSQKSIFDNIPRKPTPEEFEKRVNQIQEQSMGYKAKASELAVRFLKILADKTLKENKNIFTTEIEKEVLSKMTALAVEINNDPHEQEGMGSMGWITLLLNVCLIQRDRLNKLEYEIAKLKQQCDPAAISVLIARELNAFDNKKKSE